MLANCYLLRIVSLLLGVEGAFWKLD